MGQSGSLGSLGFLAQREQVDLCGTRPPFHTNGPPGRGRQDFWSFRTSRLNRWISDVDGSAVQFFKFGSSVDGTVDGTQAGCLRGLNVVG